MVHKTLDELVDLRTEKTGGSKDPWRPYVGLEHLAQGSPSLLGYLPSEASISTNCLFETNDILFGKLRPNLRKCIRAPFPGYCSTDILVLRARNGIDPGFVAQVFQWEAVFNAAIATAAGTKMPRTCWNDLKGFRVPCPSDLEGQVRIAALLDTVDTTIAKSEAVVAKLKQVRAGLVHDLLTRGLDHNGETRDPVTHPEQFTDSPLGKLPKDWGASRLSALCCYIGSGVTPRGGQDVYVSSGIVFIRSQNVTFDGLNLDDVAFIPERIHLTMLRSQVFAHDVLFNITGASIGRCCAMPSRLGTANVNQHVCVLRVPRARECDSTFLASVLGSPIGQRQLHALNTCGNRQGINYGSSG